MCRRGSFSFISKKIHSLSILKSPIVMDGELMVSPRKPPDLGADQIGVIRENLWGTFHDTTPSGDYLSTISLHADRRPNFSGSISYPRG